MPRLGPQDSRGSGAAAGRQSGSATGAPTQQGTVFSAIQDKGVLANEPGVYSGLRQSNGLYIYIFIYVLFLRIQILFQELATFWYSPLAVYHVYVCVYIS